jgi:23S rRNA (uracil1939-C5)-methyltransferase
MATKLMRVTIEKLVYGGAGLARTSEGVVFVSRAAPGDVVEVEIVERKKDYAIGRISALVEGSPDRQSPACPNYATAGCCHWQHIQYGRQLQIKEAILRETLQRTGRIVWDAPIEIISGPDTQYRLRASFHVRNERVGFVEERTHTVVPILECSALSPELNAFIPTANEVLSQPKMKDVREVHAICGPPVIAAYDQHQVGPRTVRIKVRDWSFDLHPLAFFQSNRYLLESFVDAVVKESNGATRVLDLFCGSGFFSIPLSKRGVQVLGVETSGVSIKQAEVNARLNNAPNVQFFKGDVEETLRTSPEVKPDLIVLNPPRTGAGRDVAKRIASLKADRIVYVSCNPSTLGREATVLAEHGYRLGSLTLLDQFPNTYHIETIAVFHK